MNAIKSLISSWFRTSHDSGPALEIATRKPLHIIVDLPQVEQRSQRTLEEWSMEGKFIGSVEETLSSFIENVESRPGVRLSILEKSGGREEAQGELQFYLDLSPLCLMRFEPLKGYNAGYVRQLDSVSSSRLAYQARYSDFHGFFVEDSIYWHLTQDPRPFDINCHVCAGKGKVSCKSCSGKGIKRKGKRKEKCRSCEGKGKIICPYCKDEKRRSCRAIRLDGETLIALPEEIRGTTPALFVGSSDIPSGNPVLLEKAQARYQEQSGRLTRRSRLRTQERSLHDQLGRMRRFLNVQRMVELDDAESLRVRFPKLVEKRGDKLVVQYQTRGKQHLSWAKFQRLVFLEDVEAEPLKVRVDEILEAAIQVEFLGGVSARSIPLQGELATKSSVRAIEVQQRGLGRWFNCSIFRSPVKERLSNPGSELTAEISTSVDFVDTLIGENASQREAVSMALCEDFPICCIQGPPGTGKTRVIVEIVRQLLANSEARVLISSQSNLAVDNVLERLAELREHFIVRVGNPHKIQSDLRKFSVETQAASLVEKLGGHLVASGRQVDSSIKQMGVLLGDGGLLSQFESLPREATKQRQELSEEIAAICSQCGLFFEDVFRETGKIREEAEVSYQRLSEQRQLFDDWKRYVSSSLEEPRELIAPFSQIVGATCVGAGSRFLDTLRGLEEDEVPFDVVIIDEAGRSTAMETLVPMILARRVVLVGDHKQLPPLLSSEVAKIWNEREEEDNQRTLPGEISLFEELLTQLPSKCSTVLKRQFRMHPDIASFVSAAFYRDEGLENGVSESERELPLEGFPAALSYHPTEVFAEDRFEQVHKESQSKYNPLEAELVCSLLTLLDESQVSPPPSVGIISFYSAQVALLKQRIETLGLKNIDLDESDSVATLDSFQGKERDVIILSLVRSPKNPERVDPSWYRFFLDVRRLNVALSRARKRLFVVGDLEGLLAVGKGDSSNEGFDVLQAFYDYLNANDCVVPLSINYEQ